MFKKIGKGIGGSLLFGGVYVSFAPQKVTTGDLSKPPPLTEAQMMLTSLKINQRPDHD